MHSLWMDQAWRRKAVKLANIKTNGCCGRCRLRHRRSHHRFQQTPFQNLGATLEAVGIDFTYEMLPIARRKSPAAYVNGDAQSLPLPTGCCDVVSIAFGIRNVADPLAAIREFKRILRPGGRLIILEFSLPTNPLLLAMYNFYFRKILPRTATLISGDKTGAYKYLPESVNTFIGREQMIGMMTTAGFTKVEQFPMTFGVCVCYRGLVIE